MNSTAETYRDIVSGQRQGAAAAMIRGALWLGTPIYRAAVAWRNRAFDHGRSPIHRMSVPVISVGNLSVGGTGKTPLVAWIARWLRDREVRVAIVSRGYGAQGGSRNDEARELEARLPDVPHLQNPDRVAAAQIAIDELDTQLVLLDDAFQHRRIGRDLDLVLVDATEPFGYGHTLPRGLLREPAENLRRADLVILTRCDLVSDERRVELRDRIHQYAPDVACIEAEQVPSGLRNSSGQQMDLNAVPMPVLAFCGIGNPAAFRKTLEAMSIELADFRCFPDHHHYDAATMESLGRWAEQHAAANSLICTHKDLVKINSDRIARRPLYALSLDLRFARGQEEFEARLNGLLPGAPTRTPNG